MDAKYADLKIESARSRPPTITRTQTVTTTRPVQRRNTPLAAVAANKAAVVKATSRLGCTKGGGKSVGFNASV
jgi:hypothetical protein